MFGYCSLMDNLLTTHDNDTARAKWPETLIDMMECNRRVLTNAGLADELVMHLSQQITQEYARNFGGLQTYIPKGEQLGRAIRDEQIYFEYRQGNAAVLARKYNLTEAQIYNIYKTQYKLHVRKVQPDLL